MGDAVTFIMVTVTVSAAVTREETASPAFSPPMLACEKSPARAPNVVTAACHDSPAAIVAGGVIAASPTETNGADNLQSKSPSPVDTQRLLDVVERISSPAHRGRTAPWGFLSAVVCLTVDGKAFPCGELIPKARIPSKLSCEKSAMPVVVNSSSVTPIIWPLANTMLLLLAVVASKAPNLLSSNSETKKDEQ